LRNTDSFSQINTFLKKFKLYRQIIWKKVGSSSFPNYNLMMKNQKVRNLHFGYFYELILFFFKGDKQITKSGKSEIIINDKYKFDVWEIDQRIANKGMKIGKKQFEGLEGHPLNLHPAVYPVELPETIINLCLDENEIVFDPFLGSGTTLIAAEKLNKKCYGIEIDPKYCSVILERWESFTNKKAVKLNG